MYQSMHLLINSIDVNKERMIMTFRFGLNPLPWVLTPDGFELSVPVLRRAFGEISQTPFVGIHADPPADLDADGYRELLAEYGLVPAPGYFSADFADEAGKTVVEAAKCRLCIPTSVPGSRPSRKSIQSWLGCLALSWDSDRIPVT